MRNASTETTSRLRVWDLPTRLFHWLLVAGVGFTAVSGFLAPAWWTQAHSWVGYGIAGLLLWRIVWGVFGSHYSRFSSFLFSPRRVALHLLEVARRRPSRHLGHNPAGAVMIFALLLILTAMVATGTMALGGAEKTGPLAGSVPFALGQTAAELHALIAWVLLAMIAGHVAGVVVESRLSRENLVGAMVTGVKHLSPGDPMPQMRPSAPGKAAATAAAISVLVVPTVSALARMPALGVPALAPHAVYQSECGDCHWAFHPSLQPAAAWHGMMAGLEDHFGEDASLDAATVDEIDRYLGFNAGEAWDTKASNGFKAWDRTKPGSVTGTAFWRDVHGDLENAVFTSPKVGSKAACPACHKDAEEGLFTRQAIKLPEEK